MDRTVFSAGTAEDANNHVKDWKDRSYKERLEGAYFLIKHAYGISDNEKLDRTVFSARKR